MKIIQSIHRWIQKIQSKQDDDTVVQWCLVGNIVKERPYGEGGQETRAGTKHFSPGTKVYCLPAQWGDGYDQIMVIGRHRGSKKFVTMVIHWKWVTNWRAKAVYHPEVLRRLYQIGQTEGRRAWTSKQEVEQYVAALIIREKHENTSSSQSQPKES